MIKQKTIDDVEKNFWARKLDATDLAEGGGLTEWRAVETAVSIGLGCLYVCVCEQRHHYTTVKHRALLSFLFFLFNLDRLWCVSLTEIIVNSSLISYIIFFSTQYFPVDNKNGQKNNTSTAVIEAPQGFTGHLVTSFRLGCLFFNSVYSNGGRSRRLKSYFNIVLTTPLVRIHQVWTWFLPAVARIQLSQCL